MGHAPQLLPDSTLWIQMVIFLATYGVLRQLVFKPYLELLALRRSKTTGLKEKAMAAQERANKLHSDYETFMRDERKKVSAWIEEQRNRISEEERAIVQQARTEVAGELDKVREDLRQEVDRARSQLLPQIAEYSSFIVTKLVGRKVEASHFMREPQKAKETSPSIAG